MCTTRFSRYWVIFVKANTYFRCGNTKPRLREAVSAQLVWTAYVYRTPSINRNEPRFDVPTNDVSICATHGAITSGQYVVYTTRTEAAMYGLGVASP